MIRNRLKTFMHSKSGNMAFLALFLCALIIFTSLIVYLGSILYGNYYNGKLMLERAITGAVQEYMQSYEVKDTVAEVDAAVIAGLAEQNLAESGFVKTGTRLDLMDGESLIYSITDFSCTGTDTTVTLAGTFVMQLPFGFAQDMTFDTEIEATSRLIFIAKDT